MKQAALCAILSPLCSLLPAHSEAIGPFGGSAAFVEVDAHRPGVILAGTSNALMFQSTEDGDSWKSLSFPVALRGALHALVVVPESGAYLAGVTGDVPQNSGIFQSDDAGRSWRRLSGLGPRNIWSLATWPLDGKV